MKKIFTLILGLGATPVVMAQSQRLVLTEEFTQASCPPCASQNPGFNTLLNANASKITSIKYQTDFPGTDPMNAENPTDVDTRWNYYSGTGVPYAPLDGDTILVQDNGSAYTGAPALYTSSIINTRYNTPSPFTMNVSHQMSADYDSMYISIDLTCTQAVSGSLKLRIAVIEKTISFTSPPGTNGEKDFYNVMRKMVPNASGTTLNSSWSVSATQNFSFAIPVPSYIRDLNQLAVVAFVQDDATRDVHQAGYSAPQQMAIDGAISAIAGVNTVACGTDITPVVTLKNNGTSTITSADIKYKIDAGTTTTYTWTGSLASNGTTAVTLGTITTTGGNHSITVNTANINGGIDYNSKNDALSSSFSVITSFSNASVAEGYQSSTFPPTNWLRTNPDGAATWTRKTNTGGFVASTACTKMDFYNSPSGQIDELYLPAMDLSGIYNANLTFSVAHARYSTSNDKLQVQVSSDCGATWSTPYNKSGSTLSTATATTNSFTPTTTAQWRSETVSLAAFNNMPEVLIKFKATSNYGNNLYIDDVNLAILTGTVNLLPVKEGVSIHPNPASNGTSLSLVLEKAGAVKIEVYNTTGNLVYSEENNAAAGSHHFTLNTENFSSGVYFVKVNSSETASTQKLIINK